MNISHLERFLTTSPDTTSGADEPPLDLDNICLLRARSMRKFVRALESIATRYAGDGDEEADDVVDLARLEVVEDRGYIRNRLALQPLSSPSSNKGKQRADPRLQLFDLLDPPSHDADPDEWGEIDGQSGGTEDEDYTSDDPDSSSVISAPSSSSSSSSRESGARKTLALQAPPSASTLSQSAPASPPAHPTPRIAYLDPRNTVTNALFERLKKRVQERASDISRHRLHKASTTGRAEEEPCGFSSPSSSMATSASLSSVLTTTAPMLSPYLKRLLHASGTTREGRTGAMMAAPQTPSTLRRSSPAPEPRPISSRKRPRPASPVLSSSPPRTVARPSLLFSSALNPATLVPNPPLPLMSSAQLDQEQADEADRRARESSEDPMLLPASSKKRRHSKPRASGPPLP
ncbi:hypothetical protein PTTG_26009 [Puccinia triticina 1-1 BBBD Race 1]|uniref:Uncharacterized protein n=1 Tax=Puccinia triticina (isolate 1-1 / race 1 (BBBD)) TaxID=630390 RepID=A0A180GZ18_PUCT1|nr:hypothetical protein PTTG_26009 [Puccinia triticina 1-1 BBBD Race 1]